MSQKRLNDVQAQETQMENIGRELLPQTKENKYENNKKTEFVFLFFPCLGHTLPGGVCRSADDWLVQPSGDPGGACRFWSGAG